MSVMGVVIISSPGSVSMPAMATTLLAFRYSGRDWVLRQLLTVHPEWLNRRGSHNRTLLWEAVRDDNIRARRFRPDLLFLLQLLLLTSLIAGLARPYWRDHEGGEMSGRHIFVLDTSASMQARERGTSRFDDARNQALKQLRSLGELIVWTMSRHSLSAVRIIDEGGASVCPSASFTLTMK